MKTELTKQFIKKTIRKIVIFAFFMIVITSIFQSMSPIVSNEIALGQMQNSNEAFVLMETFNKIRPIRTAVYTGIIVWFVYTIGRDIYKFAKTIKETETNVINEKEN